MSLSKPYHIAVICESDISRNLYKSMLTRQGYAVEVYPYEAATLDKLTSNLPKIIISDHHANHESIAWEFVQNIRLTEELLTIPVIVCTLNLKLVEENRNHFLTQKISILAKPFVLTQLLEKLEGLLEG